MQGHNAKHQKTPIRLNLTISLLQHATIQSRAYRKPLNAFIESTCSHTQKKNGMQSTTPYEPNSVSPNTASPHRPTTNPHTSAYSERPYVAMMFRKIRRLGDIIPTHLPLYEEALSTTSNVKSYFSLSISTSNLFLLQSPCGDSRTHVIALPISELPTIIHGLPLIT